MSPEPGESVSMFLWRPEAGTRLPAFGAAAVDALRPRVRGLGATAVGVHSTVVDPPRLSVVPFARRPLALISVQGPEEAQARVGAGLAGLPGTVEGWRVERTVPLAHVAPPPPGARAPGVCLLTLFRQHPVLSREAFFEEWYGRHRALTFEVHPVCEYTRNAVVAPLVPGSAPWHGLVSESFRSRADLVRPWRMFGGPLRMLPNMLRVARHVSSFLEMRTLQTYLVAEDALAV